MKNSPNIRRVDVGHTHGWQFFCSRTGKHVTKLFSDRTYGGTRKAKAAAVKYRDSYLTKLVAPRKVISHRRSSRGLKTPGVIKVTEPRQHGTYVRIRAQVRYPKKVERRSWNVEEHGLDEAIRLATNWRKRHLAKSNREYQHIEYSRKQRARRHAE